MQTLPISKPEKTQAGNPEIELLLRCAHNRIEPANVERIKELVKQSIDWEYLIYTARWHGVIPLLYWNLKNTCPELVPTQQLELLRQYFHSNNFNNLILTQSLIKLLNLLESHQIPALPFKGPLLAASVYGNLSLRRISDLDILVHEQDFQKTVDLLVTQGYKSFVEVPWESHLIGKDGITNIDLHRYIVPKHLSCSINDNFWWDSLKSFSLAGTDVPNLSPEAWFFILCLNGNKECWLSLNRICDIAEVIHAFPQMDWKLIMEMAERQGCKRIIFLSLLLVKNLLDAPIPEIIWQQAQSDLVAKSFYLQISQELFSEKTEDVGEVQKAIFHLKTRECLLDRIKSFVGLMQHSGWMKLTENDLEFLTLPKYLTWIYYLIRPIRVLNKYGVGALNNLVTGK
jgi:hypothetical protein